MYVCSCVCIILDYLLFLFSLMLIVSSLNCKMCHSNDGKCWLTYFSLSRVSGKTCNCNPRQMGCTCVDQLKCPEANKSRCFLLLLYSCFLLLCEEISSCCPQQTIWAAIEVRSFLVFQIDTITWTKTPCCLIRVSPSVTQMLGSMWRSFEMMRKLQERKPRCRCRPPP